MLAIQNKQLNSIFERIVRDKNGVLIRVLFTVVEIDGKFQGQIISATPLVSEAENTKNNTSEKFVCLPCLKKSKIITKDSHVSFESLLSPYFSLEFFMSQPTRAPAYR